MDTYEQALELMAAMPAVLHGLLTTIPGEQLAIRPAEDAWSVREVMDHMLRVETEVLPARIRRMAALEAEQVENSGQSSTAAELAGWATAREHNLKFLRDLTPDELERTWEHPKYGTISVRQHVIEWSYHDLDHLRQLLAIVQSALYPHIGGFQGLYPPPT